MLFLYKLGIISCEEYTESDKNYEDKSSLDLKVP